MTHPGILSPQSFALLAFASTAMLALSHWLMGRGLWPARFRPGLVEVVLLGVAPLTFFAMGTWPAVGITAIKLPVVMGITVCALWVNRRRERDPTVLEALQGPVGILRVSAVFAMPAAASGVYASASAVQPSEEWIRAICFQGIVVVTAYAGAILFLGALAWTLVPLKRDH